MDSTVSSFVLKEDQEDFLCQVHYLIMEFPKYREIMELTDCIRTIEEILDRGYYDDVQKLYLNEDMVEIYYELKDNQW